MAARHRKKSGWRQADGAAHPYLCVPHLALGLTDQLGSLTAAVRLDLRDEAAVPGTGCRTDGAAQPPGPRH